MGTSDVREMSVKSFEQINHGHCTVCITKKRFSEQMDRDRFEHTCTLRTLQK
jgi:hypothetical protein